MKKSPNLFSLLLPIFILALFGLIIMSFLQSLVSPPVVEISANELYARMEAGQVAEISISANGNDVTGVFTDKKLFTAAVVDTAALEKAAIQNGVRVKVILKSGWFLLFVNMLPWILIMGVIYFLFLRPAMKNQSGGGNGSGGVFGFAKSKAKAANFQETNVSFEDIAGYEETKEEMRDLVDFLNHPKRYQELGIHCPRGVLLVGPPGCGKTLFAKAMATEANTPFLFLSGADFIEMFVGVGAARVRDLFNQAFTLAKQRGRCIIFVDEIDAIGSRRNVFSSHGSHSEQVQSLNALLSEMDGFDSHGAIIVLGATNRPESLDPALTRKGRFDRQITIPWPDLKEREGILKVHTRDIKLDRDVNLEEVARGTPGCTGADLASVCNEAAIFALKRIKKNPDSELVVNQKDLYDAVDKIFYGPESKSRVISKKERELTAYHEAGHVIAGRYVPEPDPLRKVTIIPRGLAGGLTHHLPLEERHFQSKTYLKSRLICAMGGRAAEVRKFQEETSGAYGDFTQATQLAKAMVTQMGMSERIGKVVLERQADFLGTAEQLMASQETLRMVDVEVKTLLDEAYAAAAELIEKHQDELEKIAQALLEKETLTGEEVEALLSRA